MRTKGLKNLILTRRIEGRRKQQVTYLSSLNKTMAERIAQKQRGIVKEEELFRLTKKKTLWRTIIDHFVKKLDTEI